MNSLKGMAPELPSIHNTKLITPRIRKDMPGNRRAVVKVFCFHSNPRNILYVVPREGVRYKGKEREERRGEGG